MTTLTPAKAPATVFTPAQEVRIGEVASQYLLEHPEVIVQVGQKLQAEQQAQQMKLMAAATVQQQDALLNDKGTPSVGPEDARVAIVEFFDYQCVYCAHLAPELQTVMKANPDARFVFKEFPIFGQRWESSLKAARTGLQIWQQQGAEAYLKYHKALFATGHYEGKLTTEDINSASVMVKFTAKKSSDVKGTLAGTEALAQALGISGTPALVVMPVTGANENNVTVIPGFARADVLQAALDKARGVEKK
ncbi:DsbA family protein [Enterobacter chuandaensis]